MKNASFKFLFKFLFKFMNGHLPIHDDWISEKLRSIYIENSFSE